jgi:hypothetical protein
MIKERFTVDYITNQCHFQVHYGTALDAIVFAKRQDSAVVYEKVGSGKHGGTQYDPTCYKVIARHPESAQCWLDFTE